MSTTEKFHDNKICRDLCLQGPRFRHSVNGNIFGTIGRSIIRDNLEFHNIIFSHTLVYFPTFDYSKLLDIQVLPATLNMQQLSFSCEQAKIDHEGMFGLCKTFLSILLYCVLKFFQSDSVRLTFHATWSYAHFFQCQNRNSVMSAFEFTEWLFSVPSTQWGGVTGLH